MKARITNTVIDVTAVQNHLSSHIFCNVGTAVLCCIIIGHWLVLFMSYYNVLDIMVRLAKPSLIQL